MISPKEDSLRQNLGLAAIFGNDSAYELLQKRIAENADIGVTVQPTKGDTDDNEQFNEILAAAYAALMQMPLKPETYESYARAEMADHQYKESRYRR
jgi:hypothetical protein